MNISLDAYTKFSTIIINFNTNNNNTNSKSNTKGKCQEVCERKPEDQWDELCVFVSFCFPV